jgi:hypothetical protein
MVKVRSYGDYSIVNATAAEIQHPLADEISVAIGDGAMCRFPYSVELAFFKDGEWQESILEEFAAYHSGGVYAYVPLEMFASFLEAWRAR